MRKLFAFLAAGALVLGLSAQSQAGVITGGTFAINLLGNTLGSVADGTISGSASSPSNASLGAGNAFATLATTSFVTNATQPVSAIYVFINNNGAGSFVGAPAAGNALFTGMATIFVGGGRRAVIPLNIGAPGVQFVTNLKKGVCSFCLTGINAGWTSGSAVITNVATSLGGPLQNITVMGNNALTPSGGGT